jgi:hypothetical protein
MNPILAKVALALSCISPLALGACTSTGFGVGYASNGIYDDGYGYGQPGYGIGGYGLNSFGSGWYNDFYYPGTGVYVIDRGGRRHRWNDEQRRHWQNRPNANRPGGRPDVVRPGGGRTVFDRLNGANGAQRPDRGVATPGTRPPRTHGPDAWRGGGRGGRDGLQNARPPRQGFGRPEAGRGGRGAGGPRVQP